MGGAALSHSHRKIADLNLRTYQTSCKGLNLTETAEPGGQAVALEAIDEVPVQALNTYARLWQFETWLRVMVYVELRALLGDDWAKDLDPNSGPFRSDKSLTHMPTREMNALSYAQLSKLLVLIDKHWDCFSTYFPPKALWEAKLQEVAQIRHRVAHFRVGHQDDLARLKQFLRDIDHGFWSFCTSYNNAHPVLPARGDLVARHFLPLDPLPWQEIEPKRWAQVGIRDQSIPVGVSVRSQRRPWATTPLAPGAPGHLYDVYFYAQDQRTFDLRRFLDQTERDHRRLVHLCLDHDNAVRLTIPALLGAPAIIGLIERFHEAAVKTVSRGRFLPSSAPDVLAATWPEYVLGPKDPLSYLDPEMPCAFFNA